MAVLGSMAGHGSRGTAITSRIRRIGVKGTTELAAALSCSALLLGLLLVHSVIAPSFRGPDEPHHFDLAREWSHDADYAVVSRYISTQVERSLGIVEFGNRSRNLEQSEALSRGDRPRFDELGADAPSKSYNQISQHGPLYSVVTGSALAAIDVVEPGPRWAFDREVAVARLLTILLVIPVPFLIFRSAMVLGASRSAAWIAGLVPSSIPQFTHINALVTNDAMLVLIGAGLLRLAAEVIRSRPSRRLLVAVGLVAGLGMMTKAFIVGPLVAVGAAFLVSWVRTRTRLTGVVRDVAIVALSSVVGGGWWIIRNVVVFGTPQPGGPALLPPAPAGFVPEPWTWFATFRNIMPRTTFGRFGWLELSMDWRWVEAWLILFGLGIVLAAVVALRGRRSAGRDTPTFTVVVVSLLPFLVLVLVTAVQTYRGYVGSARFSGLQGRYYFSALPFVAVVVGAGYGWVRGRAAVIVSVVVSAWVAAVQWKAMTTILGYYWGPPAGSIRDQVAAMLTWSPWPRFVSVAFALVAGVGFVWTAACGTGIALAGDDDQVEPVAT